MTEPLDPTTLKQLNSPEATELHQLLKELSHTGVERLVDLPRIVVYGAQNSGKSSVLEALTHLHFPVNTGLCTRFATELQLKQASKLRIQASVKFHDNRTSKAISDAGFEESDLPAIIEKAKDEMGLTEPNSSISRDILCLDIEGPEFFPLQLVDLPGVFSQESQGQTKEDMATVNELVESYTKQTNTIIMMIVSAQIDYHSQSFAKALEKFDFKRERTLGVITKPDIAMANDRNGETIFQSPYVTLAENRQPGLKLDLGWHVLRNRGPQEESSSFEARDETETRFFRESICWAKFLGVNRAGIKALRVELSKIQFNHLKKSMPGIIEQMKTGLAACQAELAQMGGTERQKPGELRSYLAFKAAGFESLAKDAINGKYTDVFFENSPSHFKLRAQLRNFNDALAYTLRVKGATEAIVTPSFEKPAPFNLSASLRRFLSENEYPFSDPTVVTLDTVSGTLNKDEAENRGLEFPDSMNGSTIVNLFQRRSEKWEAIAKHHVDLVLRATREFVEGTLEYLFGPADPGTGTAYAITHIIVNEFFAERERLTKEKIDELVQPYKDGFARPVDSEFKKHMYRTMAVSRAAEVLSGQQPTLQGSAASDPAWADETVTVRWPFLHSLMSNSFDEKTDGVAIRGSTLDYVETYYELSLRTFTDNIINLAVENCLARHVSDIFTPLTVSAMDDEQVKNLAAESDEAKARRARLKRDEAQFNKALSYCNRYKPKSRTAGDNSTVTVTSEVPEIMLSPKLQIGSRSPSANRNKRLSPHRPMRPIRRTEASSAASQTTPATSPSPSPSRAHNTGVESAPDTKRTVSESTGFYEEL